jgi:hypothetical protein
MRRKLTFREKAAMRAARRKTLNSAVALIGLVIAIVAFLVLVLVMAGNVCGAEVTPSTGRVYIVGEDIPSGFGSCVYVGRDDDWSYVLTAEHVIDCGDSKADLCPVIIVRFPESDDVDYVVDRISSAPQIDLAVLKISDRINLPARTIDYRQVAKGERVFYSGFGGRHPQRPRATWGLSVTTVHTEGFKTNHEDRGYPKMVLSGPLCREGDSGGPVCDSDGRLIGLVWGIGDYFSYATPLSDEHASRWLKEELPPPEKSILVRKPR